jgi:5'-deoxynucleotidase YfbR-like HD superfamily hydrolase
MILLHSGRMLDWENFGPHDFTLDDLAIPLRRLPRFLGHSHTLWSVAHHSLHVSLLVQGLLDGSEVATQWALLHDAHEALIGDTIRPLERVLGQQASAQLDQLRAKIDSVIIERFNLKALTDHDRSIVREADDMALACELVHFFPNADRNCIRQLPAVAKYWPLIQRLEPPKIKSEDYQTALVQLAATVGAV